MRTSWMLAACAVAGLLGGLASGVLQDALRGSPDEQARLSEADCERVLADQEAGRPVSLADVTICATR